MRSLCFAFCAFLFAAYLLPTAAAAQKIIVLTAKPTSSVDKIRVRKFGRLAEGRRKRDGRVRLIRPKRARLNAFALPDQRLFPPYYEAARPWIVRPDMASRIVGGPTVVGGSRYASHIRPSRTVEDGSPFASRIAGGKTIRHGSRYASHIKPGNTVEQGSPWRSAMPNWKFSGHAAPVRPRGIPYFRAPW